MLTRAAIHDRCPALPLRAGRRGQQARFTSVTPDENTIDVAQIFSAAKRRRGTSASVAREERDQDRRLHDRAVIGSAVAVNFSLLSCTFVLTPHCRNR
jgi:hypothetical protein